MAGSRLWWAVGGVAAGGGLIGLGVFFHHVKLENADRWASVIGSFVGLISLALLVVEFISARRRPAGSGGQRVEDVAGDNYQFGSVTGGLRIGPRRSAPDLQPQSGSGQAATAEEGGQSANRVGGHNVQAGSVEGGVEIDRESPGA